MAMVREELDKLHKQVGSLGRDTHSRTLELQTLKTFCSQVHPLFETLKYNFFSEYTNLLYICESIRSVK